VAACSLGIRARVAARGIRHEPEHRFPDSKTFPTPTAGCLAKAMTGLGGAFTKADAKGGCAGSAASVGANVTKCVNNLLADITPVSGTCTVKIDGGLAKAEGKAGSGILACHAKELTKGPADCTTKALGSLGGTIAKNPSCADTSPPGVNEHLLACIDAIDNELTNVSPCCSAERTTISGTGGTLKVGGFAPFPFPPGVVTKIDAGAPDGTCRHDATIPPGGFVVPSFCIPALQYTSSVSTNGCESGSGIGAGTLWDGDAGAHGGVPATNVTKHADSADGVCDNVGGVCANRDLNTLGDTDTVVSTGGAANMIASVLDIPAHSRTWQDSAGCPGDGIYNPVDGDTLVTEFDFILSPTTGNATGAFVDKNADGCALPAGSAGFGAPSPECGAGAAGPCSASGSQGTGPCCVVGDTITTATVGIAFSNSFPLYDLGFINVVPTTVSACGPFVGDTCVVSTDACKF
jgi:hypothetical protein